MKHERRSLIVHVPAPRTADCRIRVSEHEEQGFVAVDANGASHAVMLEPAQLVTLAGELLAIRGQHHRPPIQPSAREPVSVW